MFASADRSDEEIAALFLRVNSSLTGGSHLIVAIDASLEAAHLPMVPTVTTVGRKDRETAELMLDRHKAVILGMRQKGYGYGTIAKMLAKRNIFNTKTRKAFSRHTIKNALLAIEKERNEYS